MSGDEGQILYAFIDTIWIEKGLSQNTLNSYKSDTEKYFFSCIPGEIYKFS